MKPTWLVPVSIGLVVVACGASPTTIATQGPRCEPAAHGITPDPGATDDRPIPPGARGTMHGPVDLVPGATAELILQAHPAVAVLRVQAREAARPGPPGHSGAAFAHGHQPAGAPGDQPHVVRPVLFSTERVLKGDVPPCLALDVPGGVAEASPGHDALFEHHASFPAHLGPGDRVVALFVPDGAGRLAALSMHLVDADGTADLNLPNLGRVPVDTWRLPAVALEALRR